MFRFSADCSPVISPIPSPLYLVLSVDDCTAGKPPEEWSVPDPKAGLQSLNREQDRRKWVLGWRQTHKDPFIGEWEQILSWLFAHPEW